jgi:hypothetical protein
MPHRSRAAQIPDTRTHSSSHRWFTLVTPTIDSGHTSATKHHIWPARPFHSTPVELTADRTSTQMTAPEKQRPGLQPR